MKTSWMQDGRTRKMVAPLSLIISAFAPVRDVRRTLTPQLRTDRGETSLAADRSGWRPQSARRFVPGAGVRQPRPRSAGLRRSGAARRLLRGDRRTAGRRARCSRITIAPTADLFATVAEMAFAGRCGVEVDLGADAGSVAAALFSEELGAVLQIRATRCASRAPGARASRPRSLHERDRARDERGSRRSIRAGGKVVLDEARTALRRAWSETSFRMVELRDNPAVRARAVRRGCWSPTIRA